LPSQQPVGQVLALHTVVDVQSRAFGSHPVWPIATQFTHARPLPPQALLAVPC